MEIIQQYITNNDCYKSNVNKVDSRYTTFQSRGPLGLMLHSVGCSQPSAKVFADRWNTSGLEVAVHAFLQADGYVYQIMPWTYRAWHCGGNANNTHIGVEMCEPACIKYTSGANFTCSDLAGARAYVEGTYKTARDLFAMLCKQYNLDPMTAIISHAEGAAKGIASAHGDPEHLWRGLGMSYTMDTFRADVKARMGADVAPTPAPTPEPDPEPEWLYRIQLGAFKVRENAERYLAALKELGITEAFVAKVKIAPPFESYKMRVNTAVLNVRSGPGTEYDILRKGDNTLLQLKMDEVYTIVDESNNWGKLKSGGWVCLDYIKKA